MANAITFAIPIRGASLNRSYTGMHWSRRRKLVLDFKQVVRASLPDALVQGDGWPVEKVDITVEAVFRSRPQDSDNLGLVTKMTIDALKGWVVPDDDITHVEWVHMRSRQGNEDVIIVTAEEVAQ